MNVKVIVACCVAVAGAVASADAQVGTFTIDWRVNGQNSVDVNPGETVTVTGIASWTPSGLGFGSATFRVTLENADASDVLAYSEAAGLGRNAALRMSPQAFVDGVMAGGRNITAAGGNPIDTAQMPQMMNPGFTTANPLEIYRFTFTAGEAGRTINVGSTVNSVNVYGTSNGVPAGVFMPSVDGAQINVVPTPGSLALLGLGGAACMRRRRRN